ncbi:hypothetical protein ACWEQ7_19655 [Streptomyces sp. NPDC004069]|uniref:hypothetical protein n=1 Tax=Streptomyces sp. NPDC052043 TaxID=3365684 RepID=UPI0037CE8839
MDVTPPLPIAEELRVGMDAGRPLSATQAHQVLLYCALDAACVPMGSSDLRAIIRMAELDYGTVQTLINWIRTAGREGFRCTGP